MIVDEDITKYALYYSGAIPVIESAGSSKQLFKSSWKKYWVLKKGVLIYWEGRIIRRFNEKISGERKRPINIINIYLEKT